MHNLEPNSNVLSAGSGDVDILSFYFDGTKYFGTALYNFS